MWTADFWRAAVERAIKSVAQAVIITAGADITADYLGGNVFDLPVWGWASILGSAFILSIATSLVTSGVGPKGSPSAVADPAASYSKAA